MNARLLFLTVFLIAGVGVSAAYGQAAQGQAADGQADRAKLDLQKAERKVARAKSQASAAPGDAQLRQYAEAAEAFAKKVAGNDDRRYVMVFQSAFNSAVEPVRTVPTATETPELAVSIKDGHVSLRPIFEPTLAPQRPPAPPPSKPRVTPPTMPGELISQSIYDNPNFIKNSKKLLADVRNRAVGASETTDYRDCVAVGGDGQWCCTGTLVAPNVVVTAGHCFGGCTSRVFVGHNVGGQGRIVNVKNAVQHPKYGADGLHNDLTVLILEADIDGVPPRKIASTEAINSAFYIRAVGFGTTDTNGVSGFGIKRMVDVGIVTTDCSHALVKERHGCDPGLELVAGAPFLDRDTCKGDSGGPVYILHENEWLVAGATSRATAESVRPCGDGGVYVRLDKYADWIKQVPGGHW